MNRTVLHQQLQNRLENLAESHQELMQQQDSLPQHQVNDLLHELRIAYELALTLHHHNALQSMQVLEISVAERFKGVEHSVETAKSEQPVKQPATKASTPTLVTEKVKETVTETETAHRKERTASKAADINHSFEEPSTLGGQFRENTTLAETIAVHSSTSRIAEKLHHQPVGDLRTAIGINERFLFIQHLFNNNAEQFSRTLDRLNNSGSLEKAKDYLDHDVIPKFGWNMSAGTVRNFMELVERRFAA